MSHSLRRAPLLALASLTLLTAPVAIERADAAAAGGLDIPGNILRAGDYNTGNLSQWSGYQSSKSYSIGVQSADVREGSHAARFEVRNGDNPIGYGDRAEVQASTGESEGKERWYSWSTKFDSSFPSYSTWQVVSQWHANADGSPPIGFYAEGSDLVLKLHRHSAPGQLIDIKNIWRGSQRRGQWQDIKLHIKWSGSDSTGFVELWIDNVKQTFDDGSTKRYIRTLYPGIGAYFKQGLYRQSGLASTGIIYHDGFRMSDGAGSMPDPTPVPDPTPDPTPDPEPTPDPDPAPAPPPSGGSVPALGQSVPAGNLTPNPAFGSGLANWGGWQASVGTATASDGSTVALVTRASGNVFTLDDSQPSVATATAGARYDGTAWVRAANSQSVGRTVRVYVREQGQQDVAGTRVTLSTAWQKTTGAVTARGANPVDVRVGFEGAAAGDAMHVGMVSLAGAAATPPPPTPPPTEPPPPPPPTTPPPAPSDAIVQDGFEGALPGQSGSPWKVTTGSGNRVWAVTAPVKSGARAMAFEQAGTGNQASIGKTFAGESDVAATVSVYVSKNTLGTNRSRSVMRVLSGSGWSNGPRHEVGMYRTPDGKTHWALWSVGKDGRYTNAALSSAAPKLGAWQTLRLYTQWNRSTARTRLVIDGGETLSPGAVNLSGVTANNFEAGLNYSNPADRAALILDDVTVTDDPMPATTAGTRYATSKELAGPFTRGMLALRAPRSAAAGGTATVRFRTPISTRAVVTVSRGKRVVSRTVKRTRPGANAVAIRAPKAGGRYRVTLSVSTTKVSAPLRVGGRR